MRQPEAIPTPANTMVGVQVKAARLHDTGTPDEVGPRIVHLRFTRMVYSDCHMMMRPLGAILLALDLFITALVSLVWIGDPRQ